MGYIYQIINKINNKSYIGQTSRNDVSGRWKEHQNEKSKCPAIRNAIQHYGINNFIFKIILICFDSDLNYYEEEYIKKYNSLVPNGYNLLKGGGQYLSEYNYKKVYQYNLNGEFIQEYNSAKEAAEKNNLKADGISQSIRKKNVKSYAGYIWKYQKIEITDNDKPKIKIKKVYQYDIYGNFLNEYKSAKEAGFINKLNPKSIKSSILKKNFISGGYIWNYEKFNKIETNRKFIELTEASFCKAKIKEPNKLNNTIENRKKIYQFDRNGNLIGEYYNFLEASTKTGISSSSISSCINGIQDYAGYFIWSFSNKTPNLIDRKSNKNGGIPKKIIKLSLSGVFLEEFASIMEASRKTNIPKSTISKCLKENKKAGNFLWQIKTT